MATNLIKELIGLPYLMERATENLEKTDRTAGKSWDVQSEAWSYYLCSAHSKRVEK
jgi:hypothetical protein